MRNVAFALACLLLLACGKDDIIGQEEDIPETAVAGDDTAGSHIKTDNDEDNVANTVFDRTVKVTFSGGSATVSGTTADFAVVTDGAGVTITNNGTEAVIYELSGTSTDGYFKLYSTKKQEILLNGLTLTNKKGAAINNQSHKRTFVVVKGSNTLADGATYTQTPSDEDEKAAFFSEGQLVFSGDGTLTVNATGKAGITSDDYVRFMASPTVKVTSSAGHGVRGKESIIVSDGTVDVNVSGTGKKGFSSDTLVYIGGGVTTIKTTGSAGEVDGELTGVAGIKADLRFEMVDGILNITSSGTGAKGISGDNVAYFKGGTVTVNATGANYGSSTGGEVYAYSSDDAINAGGDLSIEGGAVYAQSTGNDGLDANGNLFIKGGVVYAVGSRSPEIAIDANSEQQKKLYLTGGTVIAVGGLESGSSLSQKCWSAGTVKANTDYALYDEKGNLLCAFKTPAVSSLTLVVSAPSLASAKYGVTVSGGTEYFGGLYRTGATVSKGDDCSLSAYSGGSSDPGGHGGRW